MGIAITDNRRSRVSWDDERMLVPKANHSVLSYSNGVARTVSLLRIVSMSTLAGRAHLAIP